MMRIWVCLLLALGLSAVALAQTAPPVQSTPPTASATPVAAANRYSATVPVAGTSDAQRSDAIAAALVVVLQGVSPGSSPSADMLAKAPGYVRDYHYRRSASGVGLELQVDFDPAAVGRLLAQSGGGSGAATAAAAPTTAAATAGSAALATGAVTSAQGGTSSGTGTVWVDGIDSSHAFASLLALLRGDPQLQNVVPVGAVGSGVLLQVDFSQPLAATLAALETPNGHLTPAPQPHPGADVALQWAP